MGLGRGRPQKQSAVFITLYHGYMVSTGLILADTNLDHIPGVELVKFFHCKFVFPLCVLSSLEVLAAQTEGARNYTPLLEGGLVT